MSRSGDQQEALAPLRDHLASVNPGRVSKKGRTEVVRRLEDAWPGLGGIASAVRPPDNLETLRWDPPILSFNARNCGLHYDELQRWKIDVERGEHTVTVPGRRVLLEHVTRIADELVQIVADRGTDDRLQWSKAGKVRVRINKVLPSAPNRTMHDRRGRLYGALDERLAPLGWVWSGRGWWDPFDAVPIAEELAKIIAARHTDDRLEWSQTGEVRVRIAKVLPRATKATTRDRQERLCADLQDRLAPLGWTLGPSGWWDPLNTAPIADELAKVIGDRHGDDRLEWSESEEVRVRIDKVFPPASSETTDARRWRLHRDLQERLDPLGWRAGTGGWWDVWYGGLHVCGACGKLAGSVTPTRRSGFLQQTCDCSETRSPTWRGFDFSLPAELCYCCGQVLLKTGSKFSKWFCDDCRQQVGLLNGRLGRYVVPIGRHSVFGGFLLRGDAGPVEIQIFADSWRHITDVMEHLEEWSALVVKRIIAERWREPPRSIPIKDYLDRCVHDEQEKMRRFREMMEFLQRAAGPPDNLD